MILRYRRIGRSPSCALHGGDDPPRPDQCRALRPQTHSRLHGHAHSSDPSAQDVPQGAGAAQPLVNLTVKAGDMLFDDLDQTIEAASAGRQRAYRSRVRIVEAPCRRAQRDARHQRQEFRPASALPRWRPGRARFASAERPGGRAPGAIAVPHLQGLSARRRPTSSIAPPRSRH